MLSPKVEKLKEGSPDSPANIQMNDNRTMIRQTWAKNLCFRSWNLLDKHGLTNARSRRLRIGLDEQLFDHVR